MGNEREVRLDKSSLKFTHATWSSISCMPDGGIRLQRARGTTAFLEQPPQKMEFGPIPLRHTPRGLCWTSKAYWVLTQMSGHWFCPCWLEVPYDTHGRGLPEPWCRGLREEPWWTSTYTQNTSPRLQQTHTLCFWHFYTCSVRGAPATPQCRTSKEPTRWHIWVHDRMLFKIDTGHVQCLVDGTEIFLQLAHNEYRIGGGPLSHPCALVVVQSSLPASLKPHDKV